eukprot:217901_1
MKLCAPTSTSIHIEVAIIFSGVDGIIIQLDNPHTTQHQWLRGFDVSWISRYKEEDERLFIGGHYFIKVECVWLRATKQNFEQFIRALYYFDTMITGGQHGASIPTQSDVTILSELINWILNKPTTRTYDSYIHSTFTSFAQIKDHITLDLYELHKADCTIRNLILHPLKETEVTTVNEMEGQNSNDLTNLFRLELFGIFRNIKTIVIKTTSDYGMTSHKISMIGLLSLIELQSSLDKISVTAVTYDDEDETYNWISLFWSCHRDSLKKAYREKYYTISKTRSEIDGFEEHSFIINKTSNTQKSLKRAQKIL